MPTPTIRILWITCTRSTDVDELLRLQITHFFDHYKDLEANKWVRTGDWLDVDAARKVLVEARELYDSTPDKPNF